MKKIMWMLCIFGLGFLMFSCGKKTEPYPIEESIPKGLSFEIKLNPYGAELLIHLPILTKGGYPLAKIKKLIIEKTEIPLDNPRVKKKKIIELSPKLHSAGNLFVYNDYELVPGYKYIYRVRVIKDFLVKTPFTEPVVIFWHTPPSFPKNFKIRPLGRDSVLITWEKPEKDLNGSKLKGEIFYQIEKFSKEGVERIDINGKEEYFDKIKSGEKVCYSIRAILNFRGTLIPSPKTPYKCIE